MAHIDIDVAVSTFVEMRDYMWALLDGTDVEFAITQLVSSAGGWPEVRLTGPADQLAEVVRVWAGEDGDPDYHVSRISAA
jgi:hypothetical protein